MKKLSLIFLLLTLVSLVKAQKKFQTSSFAGLQVVVPTGNLASTHQTSGGANLRIEIRDTSKKTGYVLFSGYNYYRANSGNKAFIQLPALAGIEYHLGPITSVGQLLGVSAMNQGFGVKFTYSTYLNFGIDSWSTTISFMSSTFRGHKNDISGISVRLAYKL